LPTTIGTTKVVSSSSSLPQYADPPPLSSLTLSDQALILLYKWKVIKKKGLCDFLRYFPGHTRESLGQVWRRERGRAKALVEKEREREGAGGRRKRGRERAVRC